MDISPIRDRILTCILPNSCALCGDAARHFLCPGCHASLPIIGLCCTICALPLDSAGEAFVCGECQRQRSAFDQVTAAFRFDHPIGHFINRFKHNGKFEPVHPMLDSLVRHIEASPDPLPDLVTSVPIHWTTLLQRGFNQSEILARLLAKKLGLPYRATISKIARTEKQQALSRRERLHNLRRAFHLKTDVKGKSIALVDDVVTTGATAETLARQLKKHGAGRVVVWTLARTPKSN